jgi:phosphoribosylaminoimidazole-succinocarboxamide synthase
VREWLMANHFMGKEGQQVPEMSDEWIDTISKRYIQLYEKVTGTAFVPKTVSHEDLQQVILSALAQLPTQ